MLTGAMRPQSLWRSDAEFNLGGALIAAQTLPHGIYAVMNGCVIPARDVRKNLQTGTFHLSFAHSPEREGIFRRRFLKRLIAPTFALMPGFHIHLEQDWGLPRLVIAQSRRPFSWLPIGHTRISQPARNQYGRVVRLLNILIRAIAEDRPERGFILNRITPFRPFGPASMGDLYRSSYSARRQMVQLRSRPQTDRDLD